MFLREKTKKIKIGNLFIGGSDKITVQSMTNTDTRDAVSTVRQIRELEEAGCEIVRVAVPDMQAAESISRIVSEIHIPLVADIHFDYRLAIASIKNGADKIRINPGNMEKEEHIKAVIDCAKEYDIPIRVGVNSGSLPSSYPDKTAQSVVNGAKTQIDILEKYDFENIVVSLKCSDIETSYLSYKLFATKYNYPLHVGITEAGTIFAGTIKSCAGIGSILSLGIGNTIRVSLTGNPVEEIHVGRELLHSMNLGGNKKVSFISCPSCGRCKIDLVSTANEIEQRLNDPNICKLIKKPITVAVMGCAVNGPGEAKHADIGLCGGNNEALLFEKGQIICKLNASDMVEAFVKRVIEYAAE